MAVFLDIDEENQLLIARFTYSRQTLEILSGMPGMKSKARGKNPDPDESYFTCKLTWDNALELRRQFGDELNMTPAVKVWGHYQKASIGKVRKLAQSEDADLELVPSLLPEMYQLITEGSAMTLLGERKPEEGGKPRPFQKADIKFGAERGNSGNFNHPGLGKTIEAIGVIAESGALHSANLVIAPKVSLNSVWSREWRSWVRDVPMYTAPEGRSARQDLLRKLRGKVARGEGFTLVVNPAMIKFKSEFRECSMHEGDMCLECGEPQGEFHKQGTGHRFRRGKPAKVAVKRSCDHCEETLVPEYPELFDIQWHWVVADEIHDMGLYDMSSMTYKALAKIPRKNFYPMSGTPFGGKGIYVYHVLHLIDPKEFSNKMDFARRWLNVTSNSSGYGNPNAKVIGELKSCHRHPNVMSDEDLECELCDEIRQPFWDMLSSWAVRRTKKEYIPDLPDKMYEDRWVDMTPAQEVQYTQFKEEAEITIDEYELGAVGILAEYARLKQFAGAVQTVEILEEATIEHPAKYRLIPTYDSPKLPELMGIMHELGIPQKVPVGGEMQQLVVFSESTQMIKMTCRWLNEQGIHAEMITGDTKQTDRDRLVEGFQAGMFRVILLNIKAAGVSINLDRANTAVFFDETWNPDKQEQAEDRLHRGSRMHQVRIIYIRTKGTIQEDIRKKTKRKDKANRVILKLRKAS